MGAGGPAREYFKESWASSGYPHDGAMGLDQLEPPSIDPRSLNQLHRTPWLLILIGLCCFRRPPDRSHASYLVAPACPKNGTLIMFPTLVFTSMFHTYICIYIWHVRNALVIEMKKKMVHENSTFLFGITWAAASA